jgi:hypothetical protein
VHARTIYGHTAADIALNLSREDTADFLRRHEATAPPAADAETTRRGSRTWVRPPARLRIRSVPGQAGELGASRGPAPSPTAVRERPATKTDRCRQREEPTNASNAAHSTDPSQQNRRAEQCPGR